LRRITAFDRVEFLVRLSTGYKLTTARKGTSKAEPAIGEPSHLNEPASKLLPVLGQATFVPL
jgi:hypothetical protein